MRRRHAVYFCGFVEQQTPGLGGVDCLTALGALDRDYHNLRMALHWAIEVGEHELAARIVGSLLAYWDMSGLIREGRSWSAQVLRFAAALPQPWRARVHADAAMLAYRQGQPQEAADLAATALNAAQTPEEVIAAANIAGLAALETGDVASARQHFEHMLTLAHDHGLLPQIAGAELHLGLLGLAQGQLLDAEARFWASYEQLQHPPSMGVALVALGFTAVLQGDPRQAAALLQNGMRKLSLVRQKTMILYGLLACGGFATMQGQPLRAAALLGAVLQQAENVGVTIGGPV